MARLQAPEIAGPEALKAPAAVTDLYAPPPRPVLDNRLGDLAEALSSFNTDLKRFTVATTKQNSGAEQAAAQKWIAGHTNDQWKDAVRTGQLPYYADPVAQGAIEKDAGDRLGASMRATLDAKIAAGEIDLTNKDLNIDEVVTGEARSAIEVINSRYPNSKYAAAALAGHTTELRKSLIEKHQTTLVKVAVDERLGVVGNKFDAFIQEAASVGAQPNGLVPPEAGKLAHDHIRAAYKELGKTFDMPPAWMDKKLYEVLKSNAKQNPEIVWQILTEQRKDENGNPLPSLAQKPAYSTEVKELINTLRPALGKKFDDAKLNDMTQGGIDSLNRQDGSYWQLHDFAYKNDFTGEQKVIDADTIRKNVMARYQTWSDKESVDRKERPDMKFDREFPVYEKANQKNPVWTRTLEGISTSLTSPASLSNPAEREKLGAAGELYLNLSAKNYNYLKNTINVPSHAQNFYDVYEVGRRYMGLNQDQATDIAATAVNQRETATDLAVQVAQRQKIVQKVQSDFASGTFSWLTGSGASNLADAQKRLTEVASVLVRVNGMSTEAAVDNAAKLIKDRSTIINGHVVFDEGFLPPKELKAGVEQAIQQHFEKDGKANGVSSAGDLSIRPDGAGNFVITKDVGGFRVPSYTRDGDKAKPAVITMGDLYKLQAQGVQKRDAAIIEKQSKAIENNSGTDAKLEAGAAEPQSRVQRQRLEALEHGRQMQEQSKKQRDDAYKHLSDQMRKLYDFVSPIGGAIGRGIMRGIEGRPWPDGDPNILGPAK